MGRTVVGRTRLIVCAAVLALGIGSCTGDDVDDGDGDDTAVAGAVLERDEDGEPTAVEDPEDERVDPRETEEVDDGDDTAVEDEDRDAADDDDEPEPGDGDGGTSDDEPEEDEAAGSAGGDGGTSGSGTGDGGVGSAPPLPEPQRLAAGRGLTGDAVGFGTDGAEILVGGPIEQPPLVGVRADAVRLDQRVRCDTTLQAPQDRGLVARGDLTISLTIERHDGGSVRVDLLAMDLDVELEAGERFALPSTREREIDPTTDATVACEASFAPR